jgi:uncharacterized protein YlzI (FlbEa/FlbD family)
MIIRLTSKRDIYIFVNINHITVVNEEKHYTCIKLLGGSEYEVKETAQEIINEIQLINEQVHQRSIL